MNNHKNEFLELPFNIKRNKPSHIHPFRGRLAKVCFAYIQVVSNNKNTDNMKSTLMTILVLTLLSTQTFGQQVQTKEVYTFASATMLEKILNGKSIEYSNIEFNKYKMKLNGYNVRITIDDGDLIFKTYFRGKPSLNRVNDFNSQYRWARIYLDGDGDLTVAQELSFTGGVSIGCINAFINTYGKILEEISKQMQ